MDLISIIMPVLNEEDHLPDTLARLSLSQSEELIIVDGGSSDSTVEIAKNFTSKVFLSPRGRAKQMNYGAKKAEGKILFFLHADCVPSDRAFNLIRNTLKEEGIILGAFDISFNQKGLCYRVIEKGANIRSRLTSIPYGDQGIFLKKEVFMKLGGFSEIPLMEDIELGRRARKIGRIVFVDEPIYVSARRFEKEGLLYAVLRDWILALSYTVFGVKPERLVKHYKNVR